MMHKITRREKHKAINATTPQQILGTRYDRCGCSLPGLTRFTADCCEGTGGLLRREDYPKEFKMPSP